MDSLHAPDQGSPSISAAFDGWMGSNHVSISTADDRRRDEAVRLKKAWISQAAVQPALQKAISALKKTYWSSGLVAQGLSTDFSPAGPCYFCSNDRLIELYDISGPQPLVFLTVKRPFDVSKSKTLVPTWHHIPEALQNAVKHNFLLFGYELAQQGYQVVCKEHCMRYEYSMTLVA